MVLNETPELPAMTERDKEIYRGVDMTYPPRHPQLKEGWLPPVPPAGYRNLVAVGGPGTVDGKPVGIMWQLDYLDTAKAIFASWDNEIDVPWPWIDGFNPRPRDWDAIGIPHMC